MKLLLTLPLILFIPGYLCLRASRGRKPPANRLARRAWLQAVVASLVIASWAGLILLELGAFSLSALLILLGVLSAALYFVFRPPLRGGTAGGAPAPSIRPLVAILAVFAAVCLLAGPSEHVFGGWDSGEYVNMGALVARTGRIVYHDGFFASIPENIRLVFTQGGRRYMGFNLPDPAGAVVSPKFMHLYPLWLAVAAELGGLRAALTLNVLFAVISLALCYMIALRLGGRAAAVIASLLLAASALEIWFARSQCAEPLAQLFFLGAIYFWVIWRQGGNSLSAALSAACLGMMVMTKFDTIPVIPCALVALILSSRKKGEGAFLAVLFAALVHAAVHLAWWDRPYARAMLDNIPGTGGARFLPVLIGAAVCLVLAAGALLSKRRGSPLRAPTARTRAVSGAVLFAVLILVYFLRPALGKSPEAANLVEFSRLTGEGLFWFAAAAFIWAWIRGLREGEAFPWISALAVTGLLSVTLLGGRHLYPWSARRFLPVTLPLLAVFSGCLAGALLTALPRAVRFTVVVGVAALAAAPLMRYPYLLTARDYAGGADFVVKLCEATEGCDIVICEQVKFAVPLDFLCGRDVLLLNGPEQTPEKCAAVEELILGRLGRGKRVAYVTAGPAPHGRTLSFLPRKQLDFTSAVVPPTRHRMPPGAAEVASRVSVLEAVPAKAAEPGETITVDIDYNCFGLGRGFRRAKRIGRRGGAGRWTAPRASLIIPWFGDDSAGEILLRLSTGQRRGGTVPVRVSLDGREIGTVAACGGLADYRLPVPAGTGKGKARLKLTLDSPPWRPGDAGLKGYPDALGIFIDRITVIRKQDERR